MALPPSSSRSRSTTSAEKKCRRSKHILPGMQLPEPQKKNSTRRPNGSAGAVGAGDRTRTGTLSPAVDFESTTSTNSITPAEETLLL